MVVSEKDITKLFGLAQKLVKTHQNVFKQRAIQKEMETTSLMKLVDDQFNMFKEDIKQVSILQTKIQKTNDEHIHEILSTRYGLDCKRIHTRIQHFMDNYNKSIQQANAILIDNWMKDRKNRPKNALAPKGDLENKLFYGRSLDNGKRVAIRPNNQFQLYMHGYWMFDDYRVPTHVELFETPLLYTEATFEQLNATTCSKEESITDIEHVLLGTDCDDEDKQPHVKRQKTKEHDTTFILPKTNHVEQNEQNNILDDGANLNKKEEQTEDTIVHITKEITEENTSKEITKDTSKEQQHNKAELCCDVFTETQNPHASTALQKTYVSNVSSPLHKKQKINALTDVSKPIACHIEQRVLSIYDKIHTYIDYVESLDIDDNMFAQYPKLLECPLYWNPDAKITIKNINRIQKNKWFYEKMQNQVKTLHECILYIATHAEHDMKVGTKTTYTAFMWFKNMLGAERVNRSVRRLYW
jgi:hypothetical protein